MGRLQRTDEYLAATAERPPRQTLVDALELGLASGRALDLGCGAGCDSVALLAHGIRVTAVDIEPASIERTTARVEREGLAEGFEAVLASFSELQLEAGQIDLINASFALPFCEPERFEDLWCSLARWLRPGGLLVGQLFGDRDEWASRPERRHFFHSRPEVERLVAPYRVQRLEEAEFDGSTALGAGKHWHLSHLILQRH